MSIRHTVLILATAAFGCSGPRPPPRVATSQAISMAAASGLSAPTPDDTVKAVVVPPVGWAAQPLKVSAKHHHQIWLSPSGRTAYGVIYFSLPLPVGPGPTLWGFMKQMKQNEGEAVLVEQADDRDLPGVRFTARGRDHTVHGNLTVDGFHGWVVYAGTLTAKAVDPSEMKIAVDAREQTRVDLP